jgi:hypothetical protein
MAFITRRTGALVPVAPARIQQKLISAAEVAGTAALFGAIVGTNAVNGVPVGKRMPSLGGIPADLLTGVAGHVACFLNIVPKPYQDHVHSISDGALASYASVMGNQLGIKIAGGAAGSENNETASQMLSTGEGQIRGLSADPMVRSLQEANPHLDPDQIARLTASR